MNPGRGRSLAKGGNNFIPDNPSASRIFLYMLGSPLEAWKLGSLGNERKL